MQGRRGHRYIGALIAYRQRPRWQASSWGRDLPPRRAALRWWSSSPAS